MIDALLAEGYTGVVYVEHEDVLVPRDQGIAAAARRLVELLPVTPAEGRTW
jgi:sugar phosphate isomerase/epimerase